ncbi:MAG TPA: hypothetical protein VGL23_17565, partial [Chloroflexota bacterium]
VVFGQRAGGYPLEPLGIAAYGLLAAVGTALALRAAARARPAADRLRPLLALAPLLAAALIAAFFATRSLGGPDSAAAFAPYDVDDDGQSAWLNAGLALWVAAVALAARWRGLLVGGMAGHGLALALNPGLVGTLRWFSFTTGGGPAPPAR